MKSLTGAVAAVLLLTKYCFHLRSGFLVAEHGSFGPPWPYSRPREERRQAEHRHDTQVAEEHTCASHSLLDMDRGRAGMGGTVLLGAEVADSVRCDSPSICGMREEVVPCSDDDGRANSPRGSRGEWQRR